MFSLLSIFIYTVRGQLLVIKVVSSAFKLKPKIFVSTGNFHKKSSCVWKTLIIRIYPHVDLSLIRPCQPLSNKRTNQRKLQDF